MASIAILPDNLINKIAAGEVIERPASIVRELIDNSIDAAAARIDVEVLHGGKKLIKVTDDGCGMSREDALLCFQRHATSKIKSEDDLYDINTLGFRGEAISSIAAVSKITLTTSLPEAPSGVTIETGPGKSHEVKEAPPLKGTTIEVRDIFYNTPARRKFLKSTPTELSHIIDTVVQKAFAFPNISFTLRHNKSELVNAPAVTSLKERFTQLYGDEMTEEFLDISKESDAISVKGFILMADKARSTRSHQFIFVNRRPVKNPTVSHAIYAGYEELLPAGKHPAFFIFIEIDTKRVDVNVHPAKREVRFERPDEIHRIVRAAVYEALNPGVSVDVSDSYRPDFRSKPRTPSYSEAQHESARFVSEQQTAFAGAVQDDFFSAGMMKDTRPFVHIGEAFFARTEDDGLLIIDQHAAHERIMYERFLKKTAIEPEPLFLPMRIELPVKEYKIILEHAELLRGMRIEIDDFGGNSVVVRSMPKELHKADMKGLLIDIASALLDKDTSGIEQESEDQRLRKEIAARLACHKSVRGRDPLSNEELNKLIADLEQCDTPDRCPHGRPTRILISLDDLKKMFKRK
jgi:DNA mismatch repair protein MutL